MAKNCTYTCDFCKELLNGDNGTGIVWKVDMGCDKTENLDITLALENAGRHLHWHCMRALSKALQEFLKRANHEPGRTQSTQRKS